MKWNNQRHTRSLETVRQAVLQAKRPFSIRSIRFPQPVRVLSLGPHSDDFDTVGVTLRLFHEGGNPVYAGVVRTVSGVDDSSCISCTPEEKSALREEEQRRSCRYFGLPDHHLTFLDLEQDEKGRTPHTPANQKTLGDFILSCKPDLVFLPHGNDTNETHRVVYHMFRCIAAASANPMMAFLNEDPKTIDMRVDAYTDFGESEARWKGRLLRCHDSQHQRNIKSRNHGFDERILRVNRRTARKLAIPRGYAEAFEIQWSGLEPDRGCTI
jgi:LmbE family N-acetylglucosaminyl deacetylase